MHCAHLRVNGEKMSKSAGNFFTLRDLLEKGYTGREIRYVLINAHYRTGLNFAFTALEDARKALDKIDRCVEGISGSRVEHVERVESAGHIVVPEWAKKCLAEFTEAVNDDLNLPRAFAAVFDLVRQTNGAAATMTKEESDAVLGVFKRMDEVLGVIFFENEKKQEEVPAEVKALLDARAEARKSKNWAESDRLRDEIAALGWAVKDSRDGQSLEKRG